MPKRRHIGNVAGTAESAREARLLHGIAGALGKALGEAKAGCHAAACAAADCSARNLGDMLKRHLEVAALMQVRRGCESILCGMRLVV